MPSNKLMASLIRLSRLCMVAQSGWTVPARNYTRKKEAEVSRLLASLPLSYCCLLYDETGLGLFNDFCKGWLIKYRNIRQHLTVDFNFGPLQAIHKHAVG